MAEIVVFVGPTLPADEVARRLDAEVLPPVAQGDVLRALAARPRLLAIIDGGYERVPAVWHKEILYALERGVAVAGAASMGALRAAELAPFGMVGVGEVYRRVRDGQLTDDDEVAVAHLGAEDGHRPVSEAMVNIRATVAAAVADGVLGPQAGDRMLTAAKRLHYPHRRWPALLPLAPPGFATWLSDGRRDVKAADARALLDLIASGGVHPPAAPPRVERTEHLQLARPASALDPAVEADLLDGVHLDGDYPDLAQAATLRLVAVGTGPRPTGGARAEWVDRLREHVPADALADLDADALGELAADQAALVHTCAAVEDRLPAAIIDTLRLWGQLPGRLARARDVAACCERLGGTPEPAALGLTDADVWSWCAGRAGLPPNSPADVVADALGVPDPDRLRRAALRHLLYEKEGRQ
ncbi:TfuA-like protein [Plantactinospora sp. WMMB782]|uniref:TfuA-like protein n=1 Tax=Plantactinospora sp. WMMB782 TaxID=3404121 RepID=UPI003B950D57